MGEKIRISEKRSEEAKEDRASQARKSNYSQPVNSSVDSILFLQRNIGNQAVGRFIRSGALQAKLKIGQPDDIYEQEADRVAEQVMRIPEPCVSEKKDCDGESSNIQRKCPKLEEHENMYRKPLEKIPQTQGKETPEVTPELEEGIDAMSGRGNPLSDSVRSFLEPRFGYDFNLVRIHTGNKADNLSRSVNALAFTVGNNIVFSSGAYNPTSKDGLRLLAHELTHTVQQTGDLKREPISEEGEEKQKFAMFQLVGGGIGVMPDPADNPNNHVIPHHEASTRISFEVLNVGDAGGNARVGVEVDDTFITEWQSQYLDSGQSEVGYVSIGRLDEGQHTVLDYVNPGSGQADHETNTFNVE